MLRRLREAGHDVRVVPTQSALEFVGRATWEALSGNPVTTTVFDDVHEVAHVRIAQHAKLVVIAPATANLLAKAANGLADDLLTSTLLMSRAPVVFAPAMHTEMWNHPDGLEKHPLYANYMDYGPEDRHKRFGNPTLWMFGSYLSRSRGTDTEGRPEGFIPSGNPFSDQFSRYFPDLRARAVEAGHFFPEEAPAVTNRHLDAFLAGRM